VRPDRKVAAAPPGGLPRTMAPECYHGDCSGRGMMTWGASGRSRRQRPPGQPLVKRLLRVAAVLALSGGFLALWLRSVDVPELGRSLLAARPGPLLAACLLSLVHLVVRAVRWRSLLQPSVDLPGGDDAGSSGEVPGEAAAALPLGDPVTYTTLGYTPTFLVPGRLGEVVRPALLWRRHAVPAGTALASVAFERLLDAGVVVGLLLAFLALEPARADSALSNAALTAAGLLLAAGGVAVALHRWRRAWLERAVRRLARLLPARAAPGAERLGLAFLSGFDALGRPGAWWRLPALSALTWAPVVACLHLCIAAAGVEAGWTAPLLVVPLTALGIAVPTPAGVGSYHAAMTWGLAHVLGVPTGPAAAAAVLAHAASVVPVVAAGLYCLGREGLGPASLRRVALEARRSGSAP